MAMPSDYVSGTLSVTNGSVDFTGTGTGWQAFQAREGDTFVWIAGGENFAPPVIGSITSQTAGTFAEPWQGPTLTNVRYRLRQAWDSGRASAQSAMLREELGNGNITGFAALEGPGVPFFNGPHSLIIRPITDFINGVAYNVQVNTLAQRAQYDGQALGFAVLVSNVGDGRSAVYSKLTNTSGDWSAPAYVTGPVGPTGATGVIWRGAYSAATAYAINDAVSFNGSSFRKLTSVGAGNAPSNAIPPVDNTNWQVLAARGSTGDISGVTPFWQNRITSDANAAAARAGLEIIKQAQPLDPTDGSILVQGAFGLGSGAVNVTSFLSTEVNTTRFFRSLAGATGGPGAGGSVLSSPYDGTPGISFLLFGPDRRLFVGYKSGSTGTPAWAEFFSKENIVGAVAQSSGVPSGAIVERGNNANGSFTRFADGTQIAWNDSSVTPSGGWTFPVAFVAGSYSATANVASSAQLTFSVNLTQRNPTNLQFNVIQGGTGSVNQGAYFLVIGRWF